MPNEIVLDISPTGQTQGMHFDDFDLGFLGDKDIERASDIKWNREQAWWEIIVTGHHAPISDAACGFQSYESAREFEVDWFQACRKAQVQPHSDEGHRIASNLRTGL